MKILQLCKKFPFPVKDGETVAISNLGKALAESGASVTLLAMNTFKHYYNGVEGHAELSHYQQVVAVDIDNRVKAGAALLNLFSSDSYHIQRFISEAFREKLRELLREGDFEVVLMETLYLAPYIPVVESFPGILIVMRSHNVEFKIWERMAENERFLLKKWYLAHLARKLRNYEVAQLNRYDLLLPISPMDLAAFSEFGLKAPSFHVPVVVDIEEYAPDFSCFSSEVALSFIGSLDWMPNIEGLMWFLEEVWKPYADKFGKIPFHVAGRNGPAWLKKLELEGVHIHGEVVSARLFLNSYPVLVVPLLSGSGMRVKIIEGMALGRVVITTSLGLEGIPAEDQKEVLIADTPEAFVEKILFCLQNAERLREMGENARTFICHNYERKVVAGQLLEIFEKRLV